MAIIKKTDNVKITYDQKKIVLKSNTITMEVEMGMSALMGIYASGSGESKAMYTVKIPDAPVPAPVAAEPASAPAAPPVTVPIPVEPTPDPKPVAEEVPVVIVESDKDSPDSIVAEPEPVENIDDIIREADGEVPAAEPDNAPVIEEDKDNSGWETVTEEDESNSDSGSEKEYEEPEEKKYRGLANKQGWTDTP